MERMASPTSCNAVINMAQIYRDRQVTVHLGSDLSDQKILKVFSNMITTQPSWDWHCGGLQEAKITDWLWRLTVWSDGGSAPGVWSEDYSVSEELDWDDRGSRLFGGGVWVGWNQRRTHDMLGGNRLDQLAVLTFWQQTCKAADLDPTNTGRPITNNIFENIPHI